MNASYLATQMLEWEKKRREIDAIESQIRAMVLEIGTTQTVGNVRATYSGGRKTYQYQTAAEAKRVGMNIVEPCSRVIVDWKKVCEMAEITDIPFEQSEPSVTVKLLE